MASEKDLVLPFSGSPPSLPTQATARRRWYGLLSFVCIAAFGSFIFCNMFGPFHFFQRSTSVTTSHSPPIDLPNKVQRRWGQYSPYYPAGKYRPPPNGCEITQVNILQRHGARYPTEGDGYDKSIDHLKSARKFRSAKLEFLKHYEYPLGEESLIPFGAEQSFESGDEAFHRYSYLVAPHMPPYVRASGKGRVIDSAGNWSVGFATASRQRVRPAVNQILSESVNNTLNNDCPNASQAEEEKNTWLSVFAPSILKRLRKAATKANISEQDVHNLMAMCPFESMGLQKRSPFCELFTKKEFASFEYYGDVEKYYKTGYGNPLGPIQGVGYVNELLARLTGRPVEDKTQHNHSLPFPLNYTMYIDFSHENSQVAVFSAIGLFNVSSAPDPEKMKKKPEKTGWVASRMVPFSARMVVEKMSCRKDIDVDIIRKGDYVRIFVNDALQPLQFCGASWNKGKGERDGVCSLDAFVESQGYARRSGDGDFEKCYD